LDAKPDDDAAMAPLRRNTPQAEHLHVLLEGGLNAMSELMPGLRQHLVQAGAIPVTLGTDLHWFLFEHFLAPCGDYGKSTMVTRPFLERCLRQMVQRNHANVEIRWATQAKAYVYSDAAAISGVRLANGSVLSATLVIDAMGRNSPGVRWLEHDGFVSPRKIELGINVTYKTLLFELAHPVAYPFVALMGRRPDCKTQGFLTKVASTQVRDAVPGREYVLVTLGFSHVAPQVQSVADFLAAAQTLPAPEIYNAIADAKPMVSMRTYAYANPTWQRYDDVAVLPEGLLVVGDATCSLNPAFGQGMTLASKSIAALSGLASELAWGRQCRDAQAVVFRHAVVPFVLNALLDHKYVETKGWTPPLVRLANVALDKLIQGVGHDPVRAPYESLWWMG